LHFPTTLTLKEKTPKPTKISVTETGATRI